MAAPPGACVPLDDVEFNIEDGRVQEELVSMIIQYLGDIGYTYSMTTLRDEARLKEARGAASRKLATQMRSAVLDGDWQSVEQLCRKPLFKAQPQFLYAVAKQQFLEMLEAGDGAKALTFLQQRLQSLEGTPATEADVKELSYLLTVTDTHAITRAALQSKKQLIDIFELLFMDDRRGVAPSHGAAALPPHHLLTCLQQAYAYQVASQPALPPCDGPVAVASLLVDHAVPLVPHACSAKLTTGGSVKCVEFVGADRSTFAAAAGGTLHVWTDVDQAASTVIQTTFPRVWTLAAGPEDHICAGGSGGAVGIWRSDGTKVAAFHGHDRDVYSVRYHTGTRRLASAGLDRTCRLWDYASARETACFRCHGAAVTAVLFNDVGSLVITGSNDGTIKFVDPTFGVEMSCLTIDSYCSDISSLDLDVSGWYLLAAYKDSTNRIWDLRTNRCLPVRMKGHRNVSKNYVRARFGSSGSVVHGGSEDGTLFTWAARSGEAVAQLSGHLGPLFDVAWSPKLGVVASGGQDGCVRIWQSQAQALP